MKIIGIVFILITFVMLVYFGMGITTDIAKNINISVNDSNYDSYQIADNTTTAVFNIAVILPYLIILTMIIACLGLLLSVIK